MANPAPTINQINAFNATQGTIIDFNIIGGTKLVRSNRIYIYDLSDNSLICTHLYVSTESIHELPANTDSSIVYESGKSSADFVNGAQYYAQIQTFTDIGGTEGGSGLSVAKMFWCLDDPTLTIDTIPSTISTTSYNVSATYDANTSVVSNIIQQYQFSLYSATGSLLQSSGVVVGNGEQQGTSTAYDISYNFSGLSVGSSYYVVVDVTTTQGMSVSVQSNTFTVSIDTPTLGEATVVNNACDGYISVTSNLSSEYGGSGSGETVSFETDSENVFSKLQVTFQPTQSGTGTPSPSNVRPIYGVGGVTVYDSPTEDEEDAENYTQEFDVSLTPTSKDTDPYTFKAVGDIYGDRLEEDLVGATVNWNQLRYSLFASSCTMSEANDVITVTPSSGNRLIASAKDRSSQQVVAGHKYLNEVWIKSDGTNNVGFQNYLIGGSKKISANTWVLLSDINNATSTGFATFQLYSPNNTEYQIKKDSYVIHDLTAMFGTTIADYVYSLEQATAGAGVAWLKSHGFFTKPYYEYDAGTLKSVNPTSHKMVGVNAWDEEWEVGTIRVADGELNTSTTDWRSKNYISALPNTTYHVHNGGTPTTFVIYYYDANKNYINYNFGAETNETTFITPNDTHYIKFVLYQASTHYGMVYNHDICINISDPTINGKYFPYEEHTYPLGDVTLRGKFELINGELKAVGDIYKHDGSVTRKIVHLPQGATYKLVNTSSTGYKTYSYNTTNARVAGNTCPITNFGLKGVSSFSSATVNEECIQLTAPSTSSNASIYFAIASTRDIADFVMEYELATPTTEQTDPFEQIQKVSKYGTLEYATSNGIPVGHNTTYYTRDIFGGYIDLVSGRLVVDRAIMTLDGSNDEGWSVGTSGAHHRGYTYGLTGIKPHSSNTQPTSAICDKIPTGTWNDAFGGSFVLGQTGTAIGFGLDNLEISNVSQLLAWLAENPLTVVYELATPQTIQLTPQQIQTLVGVNNVWSEQGDIELSYHIPITNLLVKRQDVDDVSGNWLTLYSQPVEQASDMDFTFIDFLNQYGKTYKYALVPLLTQTQSGVEVEVEGGYTVSDEVQSIFDGVFIADATELQKCKANVGYGDVDMNQAVGTITPIGAKYPVVITNSKNQYHNGSITGTIVPDDYYSNGNLSRIDMVNKRNELEQFLTNKRAKIIKDWNGNIWLVMIMENINCTFNNEYGMGIVNFTANWIEVGDPTNQQDLQATGLIDVGGV